MDLIGYNKRVQKDKVTGFEKFAYGCGEISTNIVFTIATSLLTMFYTDVAHVSAATIGMINCRYPKYFNGMLRIFVPDLSWIVQDQIRKSQSLDATNVRTICNRSYFIDDCSTDCTNGSWSIYVSYHIY